MFKNDKPIVATLQQVSTILPLKARTLLTAAAGIAPSLPRGESTERARALDHAIERVKLTYPQFFK